MVLRVVLTFATLAMASLISCLSPTITSMQHRSTLSRILFLHRSSLRRAMTNSLQESKSLPHARAILPATPWNVFSRRTPSRLTPPAQRVHAARMWMKKLLMRAWLTRHSITLAYCVLTCQKKKKRC